MSHQQDYPGAILAIVNCGGDTDTTAAILGGIIGASVGEKGIPKLWLQGLWEWPRNVKWIKLVGKKLANVVEGEVSNLSLSVPIFGIFFRNLLFITVVIVHGFRRFLPPY